MRNDLKSGEFHGSKRVETLNQCDVGGKITSVTKTKP